MHLKREGICILALERNQNTKSSFLNAQAINCWKFNRDCVTTEILVQAEETGTI